MSKLTSKFWVWDESFDHLEFKLGDSIVPKIEEGLVSLNKNSENEYLGINDYPWKVKTRKEKIIAIYYLGTFFDFLRKGLWELEITQFTEIVDEVLTPVNQNYEGKVLYVLFRDFYVSSVGVIDKTIKK